MIIVYHGQPNLFHLKPLIALEEGGIAYESRLIGQVPVERAVPGYPTETAHRINVEREGPVLVDGDLMVTGSFFLLEYLAESRPEVGLLPDEPLGRYRARSIGQTVANMVAPFVVELGLARYPLPTGADDLQSIEPSERREAWLAGSKGRDTAGLEERLRPTLARLEAMLQECGEWFLGRYSIADIDVFSLVRNLPDLAPSLLSDATPRLADLVARMEVRPAVRAALSRATTEHPEHVFTPGPEISRWG